MMPLSPRWYTRTKRALEDFLQGSFQHDYAVFDFDNTISIGDSQWTLYIGQCERLAYRLTPEEFGAILRQEFSKETLKSPIPSFAFSWNDLIEDILHCYRIFYDAGEIAFPRGKASNDHAIEHQEFLSKMLFLLFEVEAHLSVEAACRFILYPFTHLRAEEVYSLAQSVHSEAARETREKGLKRTVFTSPQSLPSRAGSVSVSLDQGFAVSEDIAELLRRMSQRGIDLYCISSSQEDTIRAALENPDFGLPKFQGAFTFNALQDKEGHYIPSYDFVNHPATFGTGKLEAIQKRIAPRYENKAPVLVAGDSDSDVPMMTYDPSIRIILMINRGQKCDSLRSLKEAALEEERNHRDPRLLIQGRDTLRAEFWPRVECRDSQNHLHAGNGDFEKEQ
jgi:phosphoserine phosphatase